MMPVSGKSGSSECSPAMTASSATSGRTTGSSGGSQEEEEEQATVVGASFPFGRAGGAGSGNLGDEDVMLTEAESPHSSSSSSNGFEQHKYGWGTREATPMQHHRQQQQQQEQQPDKSRKGRYGGFFPTIKMPRSRQQPQPQQPQQPQQHPMQAVAVAEAPKQQDGPYHHQHPQQPPPQQQQAAVTAFHPSHTAQPQPQSAGMGVPAAQRRFMGMFELLDTLGKGMSGKVKRARHVVTGQEVALKIIDKSKAVKRTLLQLRTEILALKTLRHPNVLELLQVELDAVYTKKSGLQVPSIVLALQLAEGGELFDFMMYTGHFQETVARTLFCQLLSALQYCHERHVFHRDIKPENLLLDCNFQLKIADFGLAAIRADPLDLLRTECGTRSYMAPEILLHKGYDGGKADVWSMGVVLFILLAGNPPFQLARHGDWWFNALAVERDVGKFWRAHLKYAPHFPPGAQNFLTAVFAPEPAARPSSTQLLGHEWLRGPTLTPTELYQEMLRRKQEVQREKAREKEKARVEKLKQLEAMAVAQGGGSGSSSIYSGPGSSAGYNAAYGMGPTVAAGGGGAEQFLCDRLTRHRSYNAGAVAGEAGVAVQQQQPEGKPRVQEKEEAKGAGRAALGALTTAPLLAGGLASLKGFTYFFSPEPDTEVLLDRLHWMLLSSLSGTIRPPAVGREAEERCMIRALVPLTAAKVKVHVRVWSLVIDDGNNNDDNEEGAAARVHVVSVQRKEGDPVLFYRVYNAIHAKMVAEEEAVGPSGHPDEEAVAVTTVTDASARFVHKPLPLLVLAPSASPPPRPPVPGLFADAAEKQDGQEEEGEDGPLAPPQGGMKRGRRGGEGGEEEEVLSEVVDLI